MKTIKYLLLILIILLSFSACNKDTKELYTLKYVIFYPNHTDTIITTCNCEFIWGSDRGSNYIKRHSITGQTIYDNSAPFKILNYTVSK